MIATGREAIGSMGDTARPNVFSSEPRPFFDYFYQHFAQVTNPPLDYLREGNITDLRVFLGRAPNIFFPKDLVPLNEALELPRPILDLDQMRFLQRMQSLRPSESHIIPRTFPMLFRREDGVSGFHAAIERPPVPGLIALRAVVNTLNEAGLHLTPSSARRASNSASSCWWPRGCVMARLCEKNTCPTGIATHDPTVPRIRRNPGRPPGNGRHLHARRERHSGQRAFYGATGGRCFGRGLIQSHAAETDSATALGLLGDWSGTLETFAPFLPVALARSLR